MKGRLLALSSAAVLAVYTAGYARTRSAAEMLEAEERRPPMPRPGNVDRAPIPVTPQDPALVPAAPIQALSDTVGAARGVITENIDRSRRNPEATPARRVEHALAHLAERAVEDPRETSHSHVPLAVPVAAAPVAPLAGATPVPSLDAARDKAAPAAVAQQALSSESGQAPMPPAAAPLAAVTAAAVAPAAPETPQAPPAPLAPKWKDGRYTGWGTSRHGDLQASVLIENGRISTASISQCLTRYPCDWISKLPPQVPQRQSAEVDYVSGATESATAFYYAVLQALSKAAGQ